MNLKEILTISGYSGLFKLVTQTRNGVIVESLIDKKRMPAYASYKISSLEDIAVFTNNGEIRLAEVIEKIIKKENGEQIKIGTKASNEEYKNYFASVLPEYDRNRVYVSDMKRLIGWYNLLQTNGLLIIDETTTPKADEKPEMLMELAKPAEEEEIQT